MLQFLSFIAFTAFVAIYSIYRLRKDNLNSKDGYFLGGRSLTGVVIAGSMLLTNISTEHLIGMNGSSYRFGAIIIAWEVTSAIALVVAFGCLRLSEGWLGSYEQPIRLGVPFGVWALFCWIAFRVVNYARFADFLISVESELEKVVWPGRKQVLQSTIVVIATMLFMGVFLFGVDILWRWFFTLVSFIEYE